MVLGFRSLVAFWAGGVNAKVPAGDLTFAPTVSATGKESFLATAGLAFAFAIAGSSLQAHTATGDLSFSTAIAAEGYTVEANPPGYTSPAVFWVGGASSAVATISSGGLTFTFSEDGTGNQQVPGSGDLIFTFSLSASAIEAFKGTGNLSPPWEISGSAEAGLIAQAGFLSPAAFWLGGLQSDLSEYAYGTGDLSFSPAIDSSGTTSYTGTGGLGQTFSISGDGRTNTIGTGDFVSTFVIAGEGTSLTAGGASGTGDLTFLPTIGGTGLETIYGSVTITLAWDPNTELDLAGYKVYYSTTEGGPYTLLADVGNVTTYTVGTLPPGIYWFVVTAYDNEVPPNESLPSNEVQGSIGGLGFLSSISATGFSVTGIGGTGNLSYSFSLEGTGHQNVTGSGGSTFTFSLAGSGRTYHYGSGDLSFTFSTDSSATVGWTAIGNLTFLSDIAAEGTRTDQATGDLTFLMVLDGDASVAEPVTGEGGLGFVFAADGTGLTTVTGTGSLAFSESISGTALTRFSGTGNLSFSMSAITVVAKEVFRSTGNLTFLMGESGDAVAKWIGTGNLLFAPAIDGSVWVANPVTGTGDLAFYFWFGEGGALVGAGGMMPGALILGEYNAYPFSTELG